FQFCKQAFPEISDQAVARMVAGIDVIMYRPDDELREAGDVIGRVAPWAAHDYDAALLQVRLYHALGQPGPWSKAVAQARALAGERAIPRDLRDAPHAGEVAAAAR
ncbi:MAG TPA: hypothetical protein VFV97_14575, partial [Rhodanobacteraceae bacterium]|nr:hypothetical protein [Rhodanobacteraceae bacterium]